MSAIFGAFYDHLDAALIFVGIFRPHNS